MIQAERPDARISRKVKPHLLRWWSERIPYELYMDPVKKRLGTAPSRVVASSVGVQLLWIDASHALYILNYCWTKRLMIGQYPAGNRQ